ANDVERAGFDVEIDAAQYVDLFAARAGVRLANVTQRDHDALGRARVVGRGRQGVARSNDLFRADVKGRCTAFVHGGAAGFAAKETKGRQGSLATGIHTAGFLSSASRLASRNWLNTVPAFWIRLVISSRSDRFMPARYSRLKSSSLVRN